MNCRNVKKFLYAFADGQLSVRANCEVLDHLKMCPACSRAVAEVVQLRWRRMYAEWKRLFGECGTSYLSGHINAPNADNG